MASIMNGMKIWLIPVFFFSTYYEAPLFINNDNNEISDYLRFTVRACMADIRIIADTLVFLEGVKYCYGNWDKTRYTSEGKEIPHRKLIDAKVDLYGILLPDLDYSISLMDLQSAWFVFNKIDQDHIYYTVNFEMDYLCMHCTDTVRIRGGQLDVYDVAVDHSNLFEKYELYITDK